MESFDKQRMSGFSLAAALAAIWTGIAGPGAWATTFNPRPFPSAVQEAPVIVRGEVGMSYTQWFKGKDGTRRIYTLTQFEVEEVFKGTTSSRSIVLRELGGVKDGVGLEIPGTARFRRGEDVVVFLDNAHPDGFHDVQGMMMGKYSVERDSEGNEYLDGPGIHSDLEAHHGHNDTPRGSKWTLDTLRQLIQSQSESPAPGHAPEEKPSQIHQVAPKPTSPARPETEPEAESSPSASALQPPIEGAHPRSEPSDSWLSGGGRTAAAVMVIGVVLLAAVYLVRKK